MAATTRHAPDISQTDLERDDLEEAARDLDIDFDDETDDQTLLERIGVAMGEIDPDDLEDASGDGEDEDDAPTAEDADADEDAEEDDEDDAPTAEDVEDADEEDGDDDAPTAEDVEDADEEDGDDAPTAEAEDAEEDDEDDAPTAEDEDAEEEDDEDDDGGDRSPVHEEGEYRFEADPRDGIEPVLDLEMGPVALDVLGVEVHLRRVHAVLTANPNGRRNVVGKLLAGLVKLLDQGGDEDDDSDEDSDEDGSDEGLMGKVTSPVRGLARSVKDTVTKD